MSDVDSTDGEATDMFKEPDGYFEPEKPASHTSYTLNDGRTLDLRLVGHNPLWGHLLWNGARTLSNYLQEPENLHLTSNRTILELGAGAGLPSLVSALLGARLVLATDYPDADLIANLSQNLKTCRRLPSSFPISAEGYLWGADTGPLTSVLSTGEHGFETIILADLLFNHSEHTKLVRSVRALLRKSAHARALVWFTPYRPWLLEKDLAFFEVVKASNGDGEGSLGVRKLVEEVLEAVMFEEDPGDEKLRRTVFGYEMFWEDLQPAVPPKDDTSITN